MEHVQIQMFDSVLSFIQIQSNNPNTKTSSSSSLRAPSWKQCRSAGASSWSVIYVTFGDHGWRAWASHTSSFCNTVGLPTTTTNNQTKSLDDTHSPGKKKAHMFGLIRGLGEIEHSTNMF